MPQKHSKVSTYNSVTHYMILYQPVTDDCPHTTLLGIMVS